MERCISNSSFIFFVGALVLGTGVSAYTPSKKKSPCNKLRELKTGVAISKRQSEKLKSFQKALLSKKALSIKEFRAIPLADRVSWLLEVRNEKTLLQVKMPDGKFRKISMPDLINELSKWNYGSHDARQIIEHYPISSIHDPSESHDVWNYSMRSLSSPESTERMKQLLMEQGMSADEVDAFVNEVTFQMNRAPWLKAP